MIIDLYLCFNIYKFLSIFKILFLVYFLLKFNNKLYKIIIIITIITKIDTYYFFGLKIYCIYFIY